MRLQSITYENFRNHRFLRFEPSTGINLLYGPNGSGKTSMLEGVHFCALTKGFVGATDHDALFFSQDFFLLNSIFCDDHDTPLRIKLSYTKEKEKQILFNNSEIKPFSRHIGTVPCITFYPEEIVIVNGAPSERRRFIDNALSQSDRRYLEELIAYRRVLQQRNALLLSLYERNAVQRDMLFLWTEQLSKLAASLIYARVHFVSLFFEKFQELYAQLSIHEDPSILYRCSVGNISADISLEELYSRFMHKFQQTEQHEIDRTQTMIGPHRDELVFMLNEREIKKYASQGQLRTFLICLKLTQHRLFSELLEEKPICLLDDLFSELDAKRTDALFHVLETCGQTIITSAEKKEYRNITAHSLQALQTNNTK